GRRLPRPSGTASWDGLLVPSGDRRRANTSGPGIWIGPEDDDQDPVAVGRAAENRGSAGRGDDAGAHLGSITLEEAHLHAHALSLHLVGDHLEPALARDRETLRRSERTVDAVAFQCRVVVVAEEHPQLGQDPFEPRIG